MKRRLVYSRRARADLDDIFDFIAKDNPARAITYVREIQAACEALVEMPEMGVARPDLQQGMRILPRWRRIVIAYALHKAEVRVLRIFSHGRDYEAILGAGG